MLRDVSRLTDARLLSMNVPDRVLYAVLSGG